MSSKQAILVLCTCLGMFVGLTAALQQDPRVLLRTCWNEVYDATPSGFGDWVAGRPVRLYLADVWWSAHRSDVRVTVFTMASLDRLPMLEAQCEGYMGPLSAAIYLPLMVRGDSGTPSDVEQQRRLSGKANGAVIDSLTDGVQESAAGVSEAAAGSAAVAAVDELMAREHAAQINRAREKLQAVFTRTESLRARGRPMCELRLMLFTERTSDPQLAAIMPTNALRNAAGLTVQTPLTIMLDADLGLSASFNDMVANQSWVQFLLQETSGKKPSLCVPPAFEANLRLDNDTANRVSEVALAGSKGDVVALWSNATIKVFHVDGCRMCHKPINHVFWSNTDAPYAVQFHKNFEPWGILSRFQDPGYDERFRGWAFDKIQHVESLARMRNFRFVVLPDVWIIHRPHEKVAIAALQRHEDKKTMQVNTMLTVIQLPDGRSGTAYKHYMSYVGSMIRRERSLLSSNSTGYKPQLNPQLQHCKSVLSWWR